MNNTNTLANENLEKDIILTDEGIATLKKELNNLKQIQNTGDLSETNLGKKHIEEIEPVGSEQFSSFEEAFPNSNKDFENFGLFAKLNKYFNTDSEVIKEIINRNKIVEVAELFHVKEKDFQTFQKELELANKKIEEISKELSETNLKVEKLNSSIQNLPDLDIFNKSVETLDKTVQFWFRNQSNLDMAIGVIGLISPFLAYKGLLSQYDRLVIKPTIENSQNKNLALIRSRLVKRFNLVSVPLIAIATLYFHNKTIFNNNILSYDFTTNENKENSILPMSFFNNLKKYNKIYFFLTIISIFLLSKILIYFNPSLLIYFLIIAKYLKYVGLLWLLGWILFSLIELYIFIRLSMETFKIPSNLPNFILKWIKILEKDSKIKELRETYIGMYIRSLLFFSFIALVYTYFLIL